MTHPLAKNFAKSTHSAPKHKIKLLPDFALNADQLRSIALYGCEDCPDLTLESNIEGEQIKSTIFTISSANASLLTCWAHYDRAKRFDFCGIKSAEAQTTKPIPNLTKRLIANRIALGLALDVHQMESYFTTIGSYFFARFGFLPENPKFVLDKASRRADQMLHHRLITTDQHTQIKKITQRSPDKSRAIWALADLKFNDEQTPTGLHLLKNNLWNGYFDLSNPDQMARARNYTGPAHFDGVLAHAKAITGGTLEQKMRYRA